MQLASLELNGLHLALRQSFLEWGKTSPKYAPLFKRISTEVLSIAHDALGEMLDHKPGFFEVWWASNHNRYIRLPGVTQKQLTLFHEVFYAFLALLARGELKPHERNPDEAKAEEAPSRRKVKGRR